MAKTRSPRPPTNISLASEVARDVQLESIALRRAQFEAFAEGEVDLTKLKANTQVASKYSLEGSRLLVAMSFRFELALPGEPPSPALNLIAEYALRYKLPEGNTYRDLALRYFAELNGALNVWPYWRELVQTVASRAGLGALTLPVYRAQARVVPEADVAEKR